MRTISRTSVALAAVAALAFTACGGDDTSGDTTDGGAAATTTIVAGDLFYEHDGTSTEDGDLNIAVAAGEVTFVLDNQGSTEHNLIIEELSDLEVASALGGGQDSGTATLEAGTYTFYCDVEGHRDAGMEGTITAG